MLKHPATYILFILSLFPVTQVSADSTSDSNVQSKISMQITAATCKPATVDNVNFGNMDINTIVAGGTTLTSTLSLDCSGTEKPQRVSLTFAPADPHLTSGDQGYIKSKNSTLGYQILWADNKVGNTNQGVPMNSELFIKDPTATLMEIGLKIRPVVLPFGSNTLNVGNADTSVTIMIKYI